MATITLNGGVKITPGKPRPIVKAYRDFEIIKTRLMALHEKMRRANIYSLSDVTELQSVSSSVLVDYQKLLTLCEKTLKKQHSGMSKLDKAYYEPVLTFLSRANDAHTLLPHMKYLGTQLEVLQIANTHSKGKGTRTEAELNKIFPIDTMSFSNYLEYMGFFQERVLESIETCNSYMALLSSSLGSAIQDFSLDAVATRIFKILKTVSTINCINFNNLKEAERKAAVASFKNAELELRHTGPISNVESLVYFLLHQTISNAFKASYSAYWCERAIGTDAFNKKSVSRISFLSRQPQVICKSERTGINEVSFSVSDNGIGASKEFLLKILNNEEYGVFTRMIASNGSSLRLFPFLADLTGIVIAIETEPGQGTTVIFKIPTVLSA